MTETAEEMAVITTNIVDEQDGVEISDNQEPATELVEEDQ